MNLPNKLTVFRIILVPFFVAALLITQIPYHNLFALIIFLIASITDMLDGKIARKYNLITDFGKFLDPLADKILVMSALICFIPLGLASCVAVTLILAREFLVTSLRLVAASSGKVIAASLFGKVKTVSQMVSILTTLLLLSISEFCQGLPFGTIGLVSNILIWISAAFTVLSGVDYLYKNRSFLSQSK